MVQLHVNRTRYTVVNHDIDSGNTPLCDSYTNEVNNHQTKIARTRFGTSIEAINLVTQTLTTSTTYI